jgi:hypothetical protein
MSAFTTYFSLLELDHVLQFGLFLPVTVFLYLFMNAINELAFLNSILPHGFRISLMLMARTRRSFYLWLNCRVRLEKVSHDCLLLGKTSSVNLISANSSCTMNFWFSI